MMDGLGPGTEEGGTGGLREGARETTREGWFDVTRHRGLSFKQAIAI